MLEVALREEVAGECNRVDSLHRRECIAYETLDGCDASRGVAIAHYAQHRLYEQGRLLLIGDCMRRLRCCRRHRAPAGPSPRSAPLLPVYPR